ncbi:hypothetical protein P7K49_034479 [Saguinus oedipus]|uniref:Uncharacterized protein n=1 Tax=Saguinus oedipus TaxID=9490 RepID=A0ABQ9TUW4_SAGOE|nr:hypothetical protein P7K49_034479 [Saguinus oedipus]
MRGRVGGWGAFLSPRRPGINGSISGREGGALAAATASGSHYHRRQRLHRRRLDSSPPRAPSEGRAQPPLAPRGRPPAPGLCPSHWLLSRLPTTDWPKPAFPAPERLTPARPRPRAGWGTLPPTVDSSGASWPAPCRGPRGCQGGRAPAHPPCTKRLCGACRGLAGGQAASGKSREREEGRATRGGAPSSARALAPPSARGDQPSQPQRLYTPFPSPNPRLSPLHPRIPPIFQSPGTIPHTLSHVSLFLLVPLPTPAPLTLTHPSAIFSPPSLRSRASPILGSFPRQPWPSPTPPGGSWGHRGGELRRGPGPGEQGGEPQAAGRVVGR